MAVHASKPMPAWLLRGLARTLDLGSRITRKRPDLTPAAVAFTCHHLKVDSGNAERELGYRSTPLPALIEVVAADFQGLFERENLEPAHVLGMTTVLVGPKAFTAEGAHIQHRAATVGPFLTTAMLDGDPQ